MCELGYFQPKIYFIIKVFSEREGIADGVMLKGSADPGNHQAYSGARGYPGDLI